MAGFVRAPRKVQAAHQVALAPEQRAIVHMLASLLLDYPAEGVIDTRLEAAAAALAGPAAPAREVSSTLSTFLEVARRWGTRRLAEHYVEIFDRRRRCCLYLTYYTTGDTRYRGAAIVAFKQALSAVGYEMVDDELPDYLPVVLELSARCHDEITQALLSSHREGIEVLRAALIDAGSPYAYLLEAVCMTLPAVDQATAARVRALVAAGPPSETVGVTRSLPLPVPAPHPDTPLLAVPPADSAGTILQETRS